MTEAPAPTTPEQAATVLAERRADPAWGQKFMAGDVATRQEADTLHKLVSQGSDVDRAIAGVKPADHHVHVGPGASLREMAAGAEALRELGIRDEVIREVLTDRKVSAKERTAVAQLQRDKHGDAEWVTKLLAGDSKATREQILMSIVLSADVQDAA